LIKLSIKNYATKVAGKKNKNDIFMFTLSTCGWCMKTKRLLSDLGAEYSYIDVDLIEDKKADEVIKEFSKWNPQQSFPTIIINNKKSIIGFQENKIKELCK